jgi:hypothetical protein
MKKYLKELVNDGYYPYVIIISFKDTINKPENVYYNEIYGVEYSNNNDVLVYFNDLNIDFIKEKLKYIINNLEINNLVFKNAYSTENINLKISNLQILINLLTTLKPTISDVNNIHNYNKYRISIDTFKKKEKEFEEKKKEDERILKELATGNRYNYHFWQDEQACIYGVTELKLEELEGLKNKYIYDTSKEIYERYILRFNNYNYDDKEINTNNKLLNKLDFSYVKTEYKINGEIVTVISINIREVLTSYNKDITYDWAYDHQPYFIFNLPKFSEKQIEMYAGLNYVYEHKEEEISKTVDIISGPYFEEVKSNPSLIDEIETEFAKIHFKNYINKSKYFDGFESNANIEHKIMLELGYENKLYNYILNDGRIGDYKSVTTLSKSRIINNEDHMYQQLCNNYKYINQSKIIKKYIKENNIDLTKQLVLININYISYVFNCKMFKTKRYCLEYINNEKANECIKIIIKDISTTEVTTCINGIDKVDIFNKEEMNKLVSDEEQSNKIVINSNSNSNTEPRVGKKIVRKKVTV